MSGGNTMKSECKKIVALLLAIGMILSTLVGCGQQKESVDSNPDATVPAVEEQEAISYTDPYAELAGDHDALSSAVYNDVLGEFYEAYTDAEDSGSVSERFVRMAIAEAKLMESAIMLPLSANGGNYAIGRVAPYTRSTVMWGNDNTRFHNLLLTTEMIKAEDVTNLKNLWGETKGSGTWEDTARAYLIEHGYELKDTYTMIYNGDPKTWDVLASSLAGDSQAIVNTYSNLLEYNSENVMQPALAESWEISEDGLTYTFRLREGVRWVDSQGRDIAAVKADDFVAGMQHMMDAMGGLEYLLQGIIVNASEYISGEVTDFSEVGVKALDDRTVQYSLAAPTSYFLSMLSYGVFAPMCREYYESQGGKFGGDYDASAANYTYGKTPDNIAYCGPYLVSNATPENTIVFDANPVYWNRDKINVHRITWVFNDGKDATKTYNDVVAGVLDETNLNASSVEASHADGLFDTYVYVAPTDGTSYVAFYNMNRQAFANVSDGAAVSPKSEEAKIQDIAAMRNVHFRRAISFAIDRGSYNAQKVGEDLKLNNLRNCYTPGTFVTLEEDVTCEINGVEMTFPTGTFYGEIMQAQIDADEMPMQVWDPEANAGVGSSDGFDGWYNPEAANEEMEQAVQELAAMGIEVSAENPIYVDVPYFSGSEAFSNRANSYKQSLETVLDGLVQVNLVECTSNNQWYYAGYYIGNGSEANYDMYDLSGWMPDYGDPASYLNTFLPDYAGIMTMSIGLF